MTPPAPALAARLDELAQALTTGEPAHIDAAAQALHEALKRPAQALAGTDLAGLQQLKSQAATLREAVTRAQAQTQQGLAALLPQAQAGALYGASGHTQGSRTLGLMQA